MITSDQKVKLKKLLGKKYGKQILDILNKKKIYNKMGESFSSSYICHVLNGRCENFQIEEALFELFSERNDFITNLNTARNQILMK